MILAATAIGHGCRVEGPHGPAPCDPGDMLDGSVCACGCSAFEDCCEAYGEWSLEQHRMDAPAHQKVRTTDTTGKDTP
jgi:hypothetical protein